MLCLTPATGGANGNFLQTYFIVTYGLAPLQDIRLRNLSDLEFDLSGSLKVICDDVVGLPIYAFLLMFNSNIWPNPAPLQDTRLQNLSDLEFDVSRCYGRIIYIDRLPLLNFGVILVLR